MPSVPVNDVVCQSGPLKLGHAAEPVYGEANREESEGKPLPLIIEEFA